MSRRWTGAGEPGDFHEPFTSIGLTPSVTNVKAGDMVIFDTALCVNFPPPATGSFGQLSLTNTGCRLQVPRRVRSRGPKRRVRQRPGPAPPRDLHHGRDTHPPQDPPRTPRTALGVRARLGVVSGSRPRRADGPAVQGPPEPGRECAYRPQVRGRQPPDPVRARTFDCLCFAFVCSHQTDGFVARALIDPTYVPPGCVLPVGKQKGAHWASSTGAARL